MAKLPVTEELWSDPESHTLGEMFFNLRLTTHIPILFYIDGQVIGTGTRNGIVLPSEIEQPLLCDPAIASWLHENAKEYASIQEETASIYYCTRKYAENLTCILGPLTNNRLMKAELHSYMRLHHMHNFKNYYMHAAPHQEALSLMSIIDYLVKANVSLDVSDKNPVTPESKENVEEIPFDFSDHLLQNYRLNTEQHIPYMFEQSMLECIRKGDLEAYKKLSLEMMPASNYSLGKVAHNDLKQSEYLAVAQIILFGRAAIEGGLNPYDSFDISDMLLQELSTKHTVEDYWKVQEKCVSAYFSAVKRAQSIAGSSVHIEKCKYYISKHLRTPFTVSDIAEYVGLSPHYLGDLFHQHEPCTLRQYIIQERLNAAKNMLKYSDLTISAIADALCFQNQSHFGALFKKETGMSPAQYRKVNKPQNF